MSKLDDILKGAEYGFGQMALKGGGAGVPGVYKRAIKDLMLEIIGEDDDLVILAPLPNIQKEAHGKNILRFGLRQKVDGL